MLPRQISDLTETWVSRPSPKPDAPIKLLCLPHAGGSPRAFQNWLPLLPDDVELLPIRLAGRDNRADEPLATTVEDIIPPLARAIGPLFESGKVVIFGHSLGALLAIELAYELRKQRLPDPSLVAISGRTVPGVRKGRKLKLHELPDRHLVRQVQVIYGGIPKEILVEPALLKRALPILRADLAVNENYQHSEKPPIASPILALGGTEDPHVTRTELELWSKRTTARALCAQFPGGHFYLADDRGQRWVIEQVSSALDSLGLR